METSGLQLGYLHSVFGVDVSREGGTLPEMLSDDGVFTSIGVFCN